MYCFVNSRAPSRSLIAKNGSVAIVFLCEATVALVRSRPNYYIYALYPGVGGRNTLHSPGVGGRNTLLCAAAAAITRRGVPSKKTPVGLDHLGKH